MNIITKIDISQIQEIDLYYERISKTITYYPKKTYRILFWKHTVDSFIMDNYAHEYVKLSDKYHIKDNLVWERPHILIIYKNGMSTKYYFENLSSAKEVFNNLEMPFSPIFIEDID